MDNQKNNLIFTLDNIDRKITNEKNLEIMDLKKLLLVAYNELINDNSDKLIRSFLITTLFHFTKLEEDFQENFIIHNFDENLLLNRFINNRNIAILTKKER